jgi:hypothetical protein
MASDLLRIPKKEKTVTLWVHPEGRVIGSMFLHEQSTRHAGGQEPLEILNQNEAFLVFKRHDPDEIRFYNRGSIVRLEYAADDVPVLPDSTPLPCRLQLMDGSIISGVIREPLPPDRARLYDYLNRSEERFIRLLVDDDRIYIVNKAYIVHAIELPAP